MIPQMFMDWLRDIVLSWINGLNGPLSGLDAGAAGAGLGGVMAQAGHMLAVFISPSVWPAMFTAWAAWLALWGITGLIAVIARRGTAS